MLCPNAQKFKLLNEIFVILEVKKAYPASLLLFSGDFNLKKTPFPDFRHLTNKNIHLEKEGRSQLLTEYYLLVKYRNH